MTRVSPASEFLEHTAEVRIRVRAGSFGELAAEAGRAVARIQLRGAEPVLTGAWREIEVWSTDRVALLVDWLNELIYLAETERWVAADFAVIEETSTGLRIRARGVSVADAPARIKAATFAGLVIRPIAGGIEAEVVLDV